MPPSWRTAKTAIPLRRGRLAVSSTQSDMFLHPFLPFSLMKRMMKKLPFPLPSAVTRLRENGSRLSLEASLPSKMRALATIPRLPTTPIPMRRIFNPHPCLRLPSPRLPTPMLLPRLPSLIVLHPGLRPSPPRNTLIS